MTATGHPLGTPEDVIARLVHARITAGLSQATVGQRMGAPHASAISAVENHHRNPGLDWLTRYAQAVGHIIAVIPTPQGKLTSYPQSPESPRPQATTPGRPEKCHST